MKLALSLSLVFVFVISFSVGTAAQGNFSAVVISNQASGQEKSKLQADT